MMHIHFTKAGDFQTEICWSQNERLWVFWQERGPVRLDATSRVITMTDDTFLWNDKHLAALCGLATSLIFLFPDIWQLGDDPHQLVTMSRDLWQCHVTWHHLQHTEVHPNTAMLQFPAVQAHYFLVNIIKHETQSNLTVSFPLGEILKFLLPLSYQVISEMFTTWTADI